MGKLSPARICALDVTAQVRLRDAHASNLIDTQVDTSDLSASDRAFATLLILGVVATSGTLDEILDRSLNKPTDIKPDVRDALRISTYELAFLSKEVHAAVDQGVELVRSVAPAAAGLANAVLRKVVANLKTFPWGDPSTDIAALAREQAFPRWLASRLAAERTREEAARIMAVSNEPAPLFLAVNPIKATVDEVYASLAHEGIEAEVFGEREGGCILIPNTAAGIHASVLTEGKALVCDASAQAVAHLVVPDPTLPFLEVGSGRGTKTILLQAAVQRVHGTQGTYYALDNAGFKAGILTKRLALYGVEHVEALVGDARYIERLFAEGAFGDTERFGGAFLDVPCSGIGTLRRHPEIRWRLRSSDVDSLARQSAAMLKAVAPRVAVGGFLVYSTCTVLREENEELVEAFLDSPAGRGWRVVPPDEAARAAACAQESARCQGSACVQGSVCGGSTCEGRSEVVGDSRDGTSQGCYMRTEPAPGGPDMHFAALLVREHEGIRG